VRSANQPTITAVALGHKKFGCPCCTYFIKSALYFWGHGLQYSAFFNFNFNPRDRVPYTTYWARYTTGVPWFASTGTPVSPGRKSVNTTSKTRFYDDRGTLKVNRMFTLCLAIILQGTIRTIPLTTNFGVLYEAQCIPFTPPLLNSNCIFPYHHFWYYSEMRRPKTQQPKS